MGQADKRSDGPGSGVHHSLLRNMDNNLFKVLCGRCTQMFDKLSYQERIEFLGHDTAGGFCVVARYVKDKAGCYQRQLDAAVDKDLNSPAMGRYAEAAAAVETSKTPAAVRRLETARLAVLKIIPMFIKDVEQFENMLPIRLIR